MKHKKRKRILGKWIRGDKISKRKIEYLQNIFPSIEWKESVFRLSNPKIHSLSVCFIRHYFYIGHATKCDPIWEQIYLLWLEDMKEEGKIKNEEGFVNLSVNNFDFLGDKR